MNRRIAGAIAMLVLLTGPVFVAAPASAAKAPDTWDGLSKVKAKKFDAVYLLPGADFRGYTKVMLDPAQVAFRKNWQRDMNDDSMSMGRISDKDAADILARAKAGFDEILAKAYTDAGYQIVTTPAPDVLRIGTAVIDLYIDAPDRMSPGITRTYSMDAGEATLAIEARDSQSNALLGRAIDNRTIGDNMPYQRTSVSNQADFERLFRDWAKISAAGLGELKALSPIDAQGQPKK